MTTEQALLGLALSLLGLGLTLLYAWVHGDW